MHRIELIAVVAAAIAIASPVTAQARGRGNDGIPPGQRPRPGMCRIWIDGVPPGHQPAETDCNTAERRRPANARVIYGDDTRRTDGIWRGDDTRRDDDIWGRVDPRRSDDTKRTGRHEVISNGNVVTIDGRRCERRIDRNGTITYRCPAGTFDSRGVLVSPVRNDDRSRTINKSDDDDDRGKGNWGNKGKGNKGKNGKGHGNHD